MLSTEAATWPWSARLAAVSHAIESGGGKPGGDPAHHNHMRIPVFIWVPGSYNLLIAAGGRSSATVTTDEVWNGIAGALGSGPSVSLVLAPTGWQISAVDCRFPT